MLDVDFEQAVPLWNRKEGAKKREKEPGENSLNKPEALPTPFLHFVDRHVGATLSKAADRDDE